MYILPPSESQPSPPFIDGALSFPRFAFKLSNIPPVECSSKLKALHFVGRSRFIRFYVAPLVSYVYIIRIGRVARKAGCDRWLVRRRIPPYAHNPPTYLPTYEHKLPPSFPSRSHRTGRTLAPKPLTCYKPSNVYSISVEGACSIYVESVHKSRYVRTPGNPTAEFVKVGIQPADFNPLR